MHACRHHGLYDKCSVHCCIPSAHIADAQDQSTSLIWWEKSTGANKQSRVPVAASAPGVICDGDSVIVRNLCCCSEFWMLKQTCRLQTTSWFVASLPAPICNLLEVPVVWTRRALLCGWCGNSAAALLHKLYSILNERQSSYHLIIFNKNSARHSGPCVVVAIAKCVLPQLLQPHIPFYQFNIRLISVTVQCLTKLQGAKIMMSMFVGVSL